MLLASCATDVKLHECINYELAHTYQPANSSGYIRNISWCKDGSWLTLVPNQGNAEIIRTKDNVNLLQSILGVAQPTTAAFMRTTKKNIVMGSRTGDVLLYDIKARGIKKRFANTGAEVIVLDWNLKDSHLAVGCTDGQVTLYSNTTNQKSSVYYVPKSKSVSVVRFHRTQRNILTCASDEGTVCVWDINSGKQTCCLAAHQAPAADVTFSTKNHNLMVSVGFDRQLQCCDLSTGNLVLTVLADHPLSAIDMASDGYTLAVGSNRGSIYLYDLRDHLKPFQTIQAHNGEVKRVLYQPMGTASSESVNISGEKPVPMAVEQPRHNTSADCFAQMLHGINEFQPKIDVELSTESKKRDSASGDSFFAELGALDPVKRMGSFNREKSELSLGVDEGVKKWNDSKSYNSPLYGSAQSSAHETCHVRDVIPTVSVKPASSTPRQTQGRVSFVQNQKMPNSNISPIMLMAPSHSVFNEDSRKIVKDIVSEVVSEQMADLMNCLSKQFLNMQWSFSKQFVTQEEHFDRLINIAHGSSNSNMSVRMQQLQQENEFLKAKINELLAKDKI